MTPPNQSMKPTAPYRNAFSVFARHPAVAYDIFFPRKPPSGSPSMSHRFPRAPFSFSLDAKAPRSSSRSPVLFDLWHCPLAVRIHVSPARVLPVHPTTWPDAHHLAGQQSHVLLGSECRYADHRCAMPRPVCLRRSWSLPCVSSRGRKTVSASGIRYSHVRSRARRHDHSITSLHMLTAIASNQSLRPTALSRCASMSILISVFSTGAQPRSRSGG
jgi:hypothetical protein